MEKKSFTIAIPSLDSTGLKAHSTPRFGRCPYFTIVKVNDGEIEEVRIIKNPGAEAMGGAGPLAVQKVAEEGVNVVAGADYGPNAAMSLQRANIETYGKHPSLPSPTVKDLVDALIKGELPRIAGATHAGHHHA